MPTKRVSVEEDVRDMRAASCPVSPSKVIPYSQIQAARREEAARQQGKIAAKKSSQHAHGWSSTDGDDASTSISRSSTGPGGKKVPSARATLRKFRAKIKPRTWLYSVFALVRRPQHLHCVLVL